MTLPFVLSLTAEDLSVPRYNPVLKRLNRARIIAIGRDYVLDEVLMKSTKVYRRNRNWGFDHPPINRLVATRSSKAA